LRFLYHRIGGVVIQVEIESFQVIIFLIGVFFRVCIRVRSLFLDVECVKIKRIIIARCCRFCCRRFSLCFISVVIVIQIEVKGFQLIIVCRFGRLSLCFGCFISVVLVIQIEVESFQLLV